MIFDSDYLHTFKRIYWRYHELKAFYKIYCFERRASGDFDSQYFFFYSSLKSKKDWCIKIRCLSSCYQKISLYFNLYSIIFFIFMWVIVKLISKKLVAFDHIIWSIYRMKSLSIAIERSFYYLSFDVEIIVIFDYFYINLHPWKSNPNGTGYRYWEWSLT